MLKKTIVYENPFTNKSMTEEHYFHISKAELVKMEVTEHKESYVDSNGQELTGMQAKLQRIVDAEDGKAIMEEFEDIIRRSYGIKQGDSFRRSEEIWADFRGSGAYDQLLYEICTDAAAAAEFINGLVPSDLAEIGQELAAKKPAAKKVAAKKNAAQQRRDRLIETMTSEERTEYIAGATTDKPVELTQEELVNMEASDLQTGLASGKYKLPGTYVL